MEIKILEKVVIKGRSMFPGYTINTKTMDLLSEEAAKNLIKDGRAELVKPSAPESKSTMAADTVAPRAEKNQR